MSIPLTNHTIGEWRQIVASNRRGLRRALDDIKNGSISEEDLAKLSNFCQTSLMLMDRAGSKEWQRSKAKAEIAGYLSPDPDFKIVFKIDNGT